MVTRAWGYSGQVGEWFGKVDIPLARRVPPAAAIQWMLDQVVPMLTEMHRPRRMFVSWAEYDEQGQEAGFHELKADRKANPFGICHSEPAKNHYPQQSALGTDSSLRSE
jgi:hypothetical protein